MKTSAGAWHGGPCSWSMRLLQAAPRRRCAEGRVGARLLRQRHCAARCERALQQRREPGEQLGGGGPLLWPLRDAAVVQVHHLGQGSRGRQGAHVCKSGHHPQQGPQTGHWPVGARGAVGRPLALALGARRAHADMPQRRLHAVPACCAIWRLGLQSNVQLGHCSPRPHLLGAVVGRHQRPHLAAHRDIAWRARMVWLIAELQGTTQATARQASSSQLAAGSRGRHPHAAAAAAAQRRPRTPRQPPMNHRQHGTPSTHLCTLPR